MRAPRVFQHRRPTYTIRIGGRRAPEALEKAHPTGGVRDDRTAQTALAETFALTSLLPAEEKLSS